MCFFRVTKVEIYSEQPRLWPLYAESAQETDAERRSRMFAERKKRRQENAERNKKDDPIGIDLKAKINQWLIQRGIR